MTTNKFVENSAKAIIVHDGRVLLIRYEDSSDLDLGTWYSLPGGRQKYSETIEEALVRECSEELDVDVKVGSLLFIREYIHARHELKDKGRDQHKVEFMFRCSVDSPPQLGPSADLDLDQSAIEWVGLEDLHTLQVFPMGLRDLKALLERPGSTLYWGEVY